MGLAIFLLGAGLCLLAPAAAPAASWEVVKTFAPLNIPEPNPPAWPEEVQLGGVGGMAVNIEGHGGVKPGTLYTVGGEQQEPWHVARYSPKGEFELAWRPNARCGPKAEPPSTCTSYPGGEGGRRDIAVDQETGNVYVFSLARSKTIFEYRADGSGPIAEFGELDIHGTATTSPEKVHGSNFIENIAVDNSGNVYVFDAAEQSNQFERVMKYTPCIPGNFESYCYAGQSSDIGGVFPPNDPPARPMVDAAGNVYVSGDDFISEYDPAHPGTPVCTFSYSAGGITATAVNPETGAVFFHAIKPKPEIHQLAPCNAQGQFVESGPPFAASPRRGQIEAMTFNPTLKFGTVEGSGDLVSGSTEVTNVHVATGVFSVGQEIESSGIPAGTTIVEVSVGSLKLSAGATATEPGATLIVSNPPGILYAGAPQACPIVGACPKEAQGQSSLGYLFAQSISNPPIVVSEAVSNVRLTSATLNAQINPRGSETTYEFQYVTDAAYEANGFAGAAVAPVGGAVLGTGQQPLLASVGISGLTPGTGYRYRVVATNSDGPVAGTAERFQTFPLEAEGLPDGRAYELVSPSQKNGGEALPLEPIKASCGNECKPGQAASRYPVVVAPGGDALSYQGQPFSLNDGPAEYDEYISTRTSSGWQTVGTSPPLAGVPPAGLTYEAFAFNSGLSRGLTYATNQALVPTAPAGYRNLFGEQVGDRFDLVPLLQEYPPNRPATGPESFEIRYAGASADLSRVFFEANDALTGETVAAPPAVDGGAAKFNLYEWHAGQLSLVNVQPLNGESIPGASFGSGYQLATPAERTRDTSNAIAADGSIVFWSAEGGQVYVREDGERTRELPDHTGKFVSAATNGSRVLLSDGVLYDLQTGSSIDLTEGSGGFQGLVGQSENLSSVYFVATTALTGVPNDEGKTALAGQDNLYSWQEGSLSFVGTLVAEDLGKFGLWSANPVQRAAEASPSGRWLAFNSKAKLTDANTVGPCSEFNLILKKWVGSVQCEQVYLYDSQTDSLRCVSCNPTGATPTGGSFLSVIHNADRRLESLDQPRFLTDTGRLYFDSRDQLSSNDTNGQVEDVYQYEPAGIASCARAEGCVSLISSGREAYDSNFLGADPSGENVFFTTRQRLVPRDQDELIDVYDARVGGGIAADSEVQTPECQGEGCQPGQVVVPNEASPASSAVEGNGNAEPKKKHHKKPKKKHPKKQKKKNENKHLKSNSKKAKNGRGSAK